jgi:hypothetical protein
MKTPFPASAQSVLSRAILLALASVALWLPAHGGAQTAAPAAPPSGTPASPAGTPAPPADAGSLEKPSLPPPHSDPANPLVLFNPQNKSGNAVHQFDNDGNLVESEKKQSVVAPQDYRRDWDETRTAPRGKSLPLFGYDFFRPAREIIRARRAYLMRAYEMEDVTPLQNREQAAGERKAAEPNAGSNPAAPAGIPTGAPAPANGAQRNQLLGALFDASGDTMSDAGPGAEAIPEPRRRSAKRAGKAGQAPDEAGAESDSGRSGGGGQNVLPLMGAILSEQGAAEQGAAELQNMPRQRAERGRGVPRRQRGYTNQRDDQGYFADQ